MNFALIYFHFMSSVLKIKFMIQIFFFCAEPVCLFFITIDNCQLSTYISVRFNNKTHFQHIFFLLNFFFPHLSVNLWQRQKKNLFIFALLNVFFFFHFVDTYHSSIIIIIFFTFLVFFSLSLSLKSWIYFHLKKYIYMYEKICLNVEIFPLISLELKLMLWKISNSIHFKSVYIRRKKNVLHAKRL